MEPEHSGAQLLGKWRKGMLAVYVAQGGGREAGLVTFRFALTEHATVLFGAWQLACSRQGQMVPEGAELTATPWYDPKLTQTRYT